MTRSFHICFNILWTRFWCFGLSWKYYSCTEVFLVLIFLYWNIDVFDLYLTWTLVPILKYNVSFEFVKGWLLKKDHFYNNYVWVFSQQTFVIQNSHVSYFILALLPEGNEICFPLYSNSIACVCVCLYDYAFSTAQRVKNTNSL